MAAPGNAGPWGATWQLNPGASPALSQPNPATTLSSKGVSKKATDKAWMAPDTKVLGAIEGEESRRLVEAVEKMQGRDSERAQEAVSYCRKCLDVDGKGERLKTLANMSGEWVELFRAWEVHHGAGNNKVCQQLLLLIADLLRHRLGTSEHLKQLPLRDPSREEAVVVHSRLDGLARNIMRKRMKQIYGHLTSGQRGRANACLMLLTAINGRGKSFSGELVGTFDFTLASLAKLAAPPKQTGKGEREGGSNPEKRSTRAVFTDFALSFLLVGDPLTTRSALQKRSLFTPVLHNLYGDSAEQIVRVLTAIQKHVLPESAGVPARLQGAFFGDIALEQLIQIASFDDSPDTGDVGLGPPATLAQDLLHRIFSDPAHGVCPAAHLTSGKRTKDAAAHARLLRALLKLKATEVQRHSDLLVAATREHPSAAAAYLAAFPYSLEPRTSDRWFAAMTLLRKLVTFASRDEAPSASSPLTVKVLLARVVPPALPRAVLSRALQHRSPSVKFVSLAVLSSILASLYAAQKQLKAAGAPILKDLADQARLLLPDAQILLALNTKGDVGRASGKEEGWEEGLEEDEAEESVSTEELHLKILEVLSGYQRSLPDALAACRFNPFKLLPDNPAQLPRGEQAALLELLAAASEAAGADSGRIPGSSSPQLLPLLRAMLGGATEDLRAKAKELTHQSLMASGVFSHQLEVATWLEFLPRWDANFDGLASFSLSDSVAAFFADAVSAVSKNPYRFLERVQSALSAHTLSDVPDESADQTQPVGSESLQAETGTSKREGRESSSSRQGGDSGPEFGPLVVCALEKCLKVLGAGQPEGEKRGLAGKPSSLALVRKTGIAAYVAGALRQLLEVQRNPRTLAVVVANLLAYLKDEEASGCEWQPLLALRTAAQTLLFGLSKTLDPPTDPSANRPQTSSALNEAIIAYSSGDPSDRPALARALGYALLTSQPEAVARALPELTSALCSGGADVTSAARDSERSLLRDLVNLIPGLLPVAACSDPEAFRKALKALEGTQKAAKGGRVLDQIKEVSVPPLGTFLSSLPFVAVHSAACEMSSRPEDPSQHSALSFGSPGVNALLRTLLQQLPATERATAIRVLLHHLDSLLAPAQASVTLSSNVNTLFDLLQRAVFTPPSSGQLSTAPPERNNGSSIPSADLAVDALEHPALSARFLRQHDVTGRGQFSPEADVRIADLVLDMLTGARSECEVGGRDAEGSGPRIQPGMRLGLSEGSRNALERACSGYVESAVSAVERSLKSGGNEEGLEAAIKLTPFGDTPSLLRLLDRLLPSPAQIPQILQTPRPRLPLPQDSKSRSALTVKTLNPDSLKPGAPSAPGLRRLALQLAGRLLSELPSALTSERRGPALTSAKSLSAAGKRVEGMGYREVYRRVAELAVMEQTPDGMDGMAGMNGVSELGGIDGADACLLLALRTTERALAEAACETVGIACQQISSGEVIIETVPSLSADRPTDVSFVSRPIGPASENRQRDPGSVLREGGLVLSSDLAAVTPPALVRKYVEQPTTTRAEILRILVRSSSEHRAGFGAHLRQRLGDLPAADKLLLVAPVKEYLRAVKGDRFGAAEKGEEAFGSRDLETERSDDVTLVAKAYLGLVTGYLLEPGSACGGGALENGLTGTPRLEGAGATVNGGSPGAKRKAEDGEEERKMGKGKSVGPGPRKSKKRKANGVEAPIAVGAENGSRVLVPRGGSGAAGVIANAVELFRCCSALVPPTEEERNRMLRKLLPKGGWHFDIGQSPASVKNSAESSNGAEGDARFRIGAVHCLQQAAVARLLILKHGAEDKRETGPDSTDASLEVQVDSKHLMRYAQTVMTSLISLHRLQGASSETERVKVGLETGLLSLLAEAAGYVTGLTDKFAAAVASFVESLLRWRFTDTGSLTVVRLLLTAVSESAKKPDLEDGLADNPADGATLMEEGEARAEIGNENGDGQAGILDDQSLSKGSQKVAEMGARLFDLLVSHSQFVPVLLASRAETDSSAQNPKPLPEAMGKHSGDFVPGSLASILSLLDTPPLPVRFDKQSSRESAKESQLNLGSFLASEASVSGIIAQLLSTPALESVPKDGQSSTAAPQDAILETQKPSSHGKAAALPIAENATPESTRLELVQLLTTLQELRNLHASPNTDSQSRPPNDLLSLLLAAYGATMSDLDRRILHLMRQIDGQGGGLAGMEYLWGERALRSRQEQRLSGVSLDPGARSRQFREESPLDPRRCGLSVLYFPVRRSLNPPQPNEGAGSKGAAIDPEEDLRSAGYDPSYLLPFAVHILKTGAMEARDFARSGLLQIALAALAAADEGMRRAGYNVLALSMANLEDPGTSFREKQQVRLLLHYVRNAITEPLQRIPMTSAAFAAEAACIQMHPEHQLYSALNKFLLKRPALDLEDIPLFYSLFNSGSPSYRTERVWMLRLLAAGLVTSADGRVFRRRFVLELLMSFAESAMADAFTRRLVMQVLRHAVRIHKCASDLVDHAGLVPWLANLVVSPRLGPTPSDAADTAIVATMALEVLEGLLAAASDDWSRDAAFDDFLAAVKVVHRKLAVTVSEPVTVAVTLPFLRLAAGLAAWNARRKRSAGPVFSIRELRTLLTYVTAFGSLEAVRWALQLLLHLPRPSMQSGAPPETFHVADWAVIAARALDSGALTLGKFAGVSWGERVLGWLPDKSDTPEDGVQDLERYTAILM